MLLSRPSTPCFLRTGSPTSSVSDSFVSLIGRHTVPRAYDSFATSFVCSELPIPAHLPLDLGSESEAGSESEDGVPFPNPVPIVAGKFLRRDRSLLQSRRSKHLVPNTSLVLKEALRPPAELKTLETRANFIYYKGKQWCEVNKALVVDRKYPKPDPDGVRRKHSEAHQEAIRLTRRETEQGPVEQINGEVKEGVSERESEQSLAVSEQLKGIFAEIKPIPELSVKPEPWQFLALKTVEERFRKEAQKKPCYWKRNVYPPKSFEDRVRERRSRRPPPKPQHLETDYLSGIWEPELMVGQFRASGLNYEPSISFGAQPASTITWYELQEAILKCSNWMDSCQDFL